eukprot:CAMPEP_0174738156 /NCGR_PEP_ID=MMETSP1094-20130205/69492_1 /TAXON_ID=156173 /ORGANISM="Chrysochromulina brevifilum, Strain UTEX LB 985" /LENGTH=179 /DNA_ID=CAMNT_0015941511 /DNA_START=266 /DNA_END=801 /DNA_ORIENTATION=-
MKPIAAGLLHACAAPVPKVPRSLPDAARRAVEVRNHHISITVEIRRLETERGAHYTRAIHPNGPNSALQDYAKLCTRIRKALTASAAHTPLPRSLAPVISVYCETLKQHTLLADHGLAHVDDLSRFADDTITTLEDPASDLEESTTPLEPPASGVSPAGAEAPMPAPPSEPIVTDRPST